MSNFWDRLREERKRLGLSQADFGQIGEVQKQAQLKYEKGERSPDGKYFEAIAKAGVDVQYLITGARSLVMLTPEEQLLIERYRASEQPLKEAALRVLLGERLGANIQTIYAAGAANVAGRDINNKGK